MTGVERQDSGRDLARRSAVGFVVLLGCISLLGDVTYEGARGIAGPFLAALGASGTAVSMIAGFGELIGYGIRLVSGRIADRSKRYWSITILGYAINLLSVPLLALAGRWEIAAALLVTERVGKGIRNPPRDAMLSHATHLLGAGWAFGLHEAMDQIGAVSGPLIVAAVLHSTGSYQKSFGALIVSAVLALALLLRARALYPRPQDLEPKAPPLPSSNLPRAYWIYLAGAGLVAAGYADFPLIAFHFERTRVVSQDMIPVFYAGAMAVDAVAALVFGRLFDRIGIGALIGSSLLSSMFAPLAFWGGPAGALGGVILWGIGMGAQESVMRAAVATMAPPDRRANAYGTFNAGFGVAWFVGSATLGALYDVSLPALVVFSVAAQLLSVPLLIAAGRAQRPG